MQHTKWRRSIITQNVSRTQSGHVHLLTRNSFVPAFTFTLSCMTHVLRACCTFSRPPPARPPHPRFGWFLHSPLIVAIRHCCCPTTRAEADNLSVDCERGNPRISFGDRPALGGRSERWWRCGGPNCVHTGHGTLALARSYRLVVSVRSR